MPVKKIIPTSELAMLVSPGMTHFRIVQFSTSDSGGEEQTDELEYVAILSTN